jgi:hypothetical protein
MVVLGTIDFKKYPEIDWSAQNITIHDGMEK